VFNIGKVEFKDLTLFEKIAWFGVIYICISVCVTLLCLLFLNKVFLLGGPLGMIRAIFLLILALIGLVLYGTKKATGNAKSDLTANEQIKDTIKKTSTWLNDLKKEWENGKR